MSRNAHCDRGPLERGRSTEPERRTTESKQVIAKRLWCELRQQDGWPGQLNFEGIKWNGMGEAGVRVCGQPIETGTSHREGGG